MKRWLISILMLMMMLLAACTPKIYGVPKENWETMSEPERVAAMEAYKARQEVLRQQREEQARLRAMEKEAQLAREAEEARQRQLQIDAVYRGEGLYGDLLRVNLEGGTLLIHGSYQPYHPFSFRIAALESKEVEIVSKRGQKTRMSVSYDGSNLLLDETLNARRSTALRLPYDDGWETGATYTNRSAKGPLGMRGVNVAVQIIGQPPREHHGRRHKPQVIIVQPPVHKPSNPEVIVIREPEHRPRPDGAVMGRRPEPEKIVQHPSPGRIKVVFRNGTINLKKQRSPLVPQTIDLRDGQVRYVSLRSRNGNLKIRISYLEGELVIADSPDKGSKGTRLGYLPGWKNGQRYAIESSGNRLLEDLDILVTAQ